MYSSDTLLTFVQAFVLPNNAWLSACIVNELVEICVAEHWWSRVPVAQ